MAYGSATSVDTTPFSNRTESSSGYSASTSFLIASFSSDGRKMNVAISTTGVAEAMTEEARMSNMKYPRTDESGLSRIVR